MLSSHRLKLSRTAEGHPEVPLLTRRSRSEAAEASTQRGASWPHAGADEELPIVLIDDPLRECQTEPVATVCLGGKERFKEPLQRFVIAIALAMRFESTCRMGAPCTCATSLSGSLGTRWTFFASIVL